MSSKVLLIDDLAGYGKVALSAMIPLLWASTSALASCIRILCLRWLSSLPAWPWVLLVLRICGLPFLPMWVL